MIHRSIIGDPLREERTGSVRGITGVGANHMIAWIHKCFRQMKDGLFRSDRRNDHRVGTDRHSESPLKPVRNRPSIVFTATEWRITTGRMLLYRLCTRFANQLRRRSGGISHPQIHRVKTPLFQLRSPLSNGSHGISAQLAQSMGNHSCSFNIVVGFSKVSAP